MAKRNLYWRLFRGLLANPRYFYFIWRREAHTQTAARLARQDVPQNGTLLSRSNSISGSSTPATCGAKCVRNGGIPGTYFAYGTSKLQQQLNLQVIERVVRELAPHGLRYVDMEGGKTFLHPEIIELFRMLKSYGLFVKPVTNGTLLKQYAQDVIASGIDAINVSVDGNRETHNHVRQRAWAYDRTMEGLLALVEAKPRRDALSHSSRSPSPCPATTRPRPSRSSARTWPARGSWTLLVVKSSPIWVPAAKGQAYNALVEKHFGVRGIQSWQGFLEDYSHFGAEAQDMVETLRELKAKAYDFFIAVVPTVPAHDLPRLYTDYDWNLGRTHCPIAYVEPQDRQRRPCLSLQSLYG